MKLLTKTLRAYAVFSFLVLVISAPLFYFLAEKLFIDDADETLLIRKKEFITYDLPAMELNEIKISNKFNRDLKIDAVEQAIEKDTMFYRSYIDTLANEDEPYRVLISPIQIKGRPFTLTTRINLIESRDVIESIAILFMVIVSALLIGMYFITRRLSNKIWQPFYATLANIEQFDLDKNDKPELQKSNIEEFSRLNNSVDKLMERNLFVYKHQKEFIENASHELQTPLAIFQAKLDMLTQQVHFTDQLGTTLTDLNDAAHRLSRINKNLLLLSKIENEQYEATEKIEAHTIIKKLAAFFTEQGEEKSIRIVMTDIEPLILKANSTLFEITISNFFLNAIRYNHNQGEIVVKLQNNSLQIANTSTNPALDPKKLFQRFSQPGSGSGTGLGLAIIKKISDLHGWQSTYHYADQKHIFQIAF